MTRRPWLRAASTLALTTLLGACGSSKPVERPEPRPAQAALVAEAAFSGGIIIAAEDRRDVDAGATRQRMERLSLEIGREAAGAQTSAGQAEAVSRIMFGRHNFQVDPQDPAGERLSSFDVPMALERRRGACLPIAIIAARAASGAGLLAGVCRAPGHALISIGPPTDRVYLDPGQRGAVVAWADVGRDHPWSPAAGHLYNGRPLFSEEIVAQLRATRAGLRLAAGHVEAAERDARDALRIVADLPEGLVNLAAILTKRGEAEEAWKNLQRAHTLLPRNAVVNYNCGLAAAARGDALAAIAFYETALEADPSFEKARANKEALEKQRR